jgi:D-alanyl-D-alanine carboxypeptidase
MKNFLIFLLIVQFFIGDLDARESKIKTVKEIEKVTKSKQVKNNPKMKTLSKRIKKNEIKKNKQDIKIEKLSIKKSVLISRLPVKNKLSSKLQIDNLKITTIDNFKCGDGFSSLVLNEENGKVLYEKRAEEIIYPASLAKVMTLYLAFDALKKNQLKLDQVLTVSANGEEVARVNKNNSLRLKSGDKISVEDLIKAITVKSFNEAAVTLAEGISKDEWKFAEEMNKKAMELGMANTNFKNSSGLHDDGQYTTNYDLARLGTKVKKDFPEYEHYFSIKKFRYRGNDYLTHNHVLLEYKGADGLKTGFTRASGFNLIASAKRGDKKVMSILTGCESHQKRDYFTKSLLNKSFDILKKNGGESFEQALVIF